MPILYDRKKLIIIAVIALSGAISACTGMAPVQEMSNARQTLMTAKAVRADVYARDAYGRAKGFLDAAAIELNSGDYYRARELAVLAAHEAKQARLDAISHQKSD